MRVKAPLMALLVVMAGVVGVVSLGHDAPVVGDEIEDASLVGQAQAAVPAVVIAGGLTGLVAYNVAESWLTDSGASEDNLTKADATETKKEIYTTASVLRQDQQTLFTSLDNYLQDTGSIARMEGKNAMIRALNNGTTKAEAKIAAKDAVADYYAGRQKTLLASFETTTETILSANDTAANTTGLNHTILGGGGNQGYIYAYFPNTPSLTEYGPLTETTVNLTLVNSTNQSVTTFDVENSVYEMTSADYMVRDSANNNPSYVDTMNVSAPSTNFNDSVVLDFSQYYSRWTDIQNQNTQIQNEMGTLVDNVYSSYTQGTINNSELIDPYLAAREYSPENDSMAFTLRTLTSIGISPPDGLDAGVTMNVTDDDQIVTYNDVIFMSDGSPSGTGTFSVGQQYDAANIAGVQGVLDPTGGTWTELDGNFTIESAQRNGTSLSNVDMHQVNYTSADISEFQTLMSDLNNLTAEINAYQQELRSSGGGAWFNFGNLGNIGGIGAVAILLLGGMWVLSARPRRRS